MTDVADQKVLFATRRLYLAFKQALPAAMREQLDVWQERVEGAVAPIVREFLGGAR